MSKPERPVVCVIGPVQPYRGGIAQYTESLRAAFDPVADVHTFSFEKQYPAMLYPGETDVIPGAERLADVRYTISATNPLSWRRTVREIAALKPDLVLINWWTLYWQPWTALMSSWLRRRGITVVFLCHNIGDHGSGGLRKRLGAAMLRRADGYVVHSSMLAEEVSDRVPGKPVLTRPLPVFDNFPEARENWQPRGRLDLLFFGFIRPYKGLDVLLDAFQELADPDVALSVIGESWEDARPLHARAEALGIEMRTEYVSDDEAAEYFARADVVVLPYLSAAGSAVIATAFHHGKPVIATRVGGIPDVVTAGTGWLIEPASAEHLRDAITTVTRDAAREMAPAVRARAAEMSWPELAAAVLAEFVRT